MWKERCWLSEETVGGYFPRASVDVQVNISNINQY